MATRFYQLKITLNGSKPPIWRRVVVDADTRLDELHQIIQKAMGWDDDHLHMFQVGREFYGPPNLEVRPERTCRLAEVASQAKCKLGYTYDMGDCWEHTILVEKILDGCGSVPTCVGGARACPMEDCGGMGGYLDLLSILADPSDPEHEDRLEWAGGRIDPEAFDLEAADLSLAGLRKSVKKKARA